MSTRSHIRVDDFTVSKHHIRWVEGELRKHPHRKRRLRGLEDSIIRSTPDVEPGMPRADGPGNPTPNRAIALMHDSERAHLSLLVRGVQETYDDLEPRQQEIIKGLYWECRYTMEGIAYNLELDRKTVWKLRNRALVAFVINLIGDWAVENSPNRPHQ